MASLTAAEGEQQMSKGSMAVAASYRSTMTELGGGELQIGDEPKERRAADERELKVASLTAAEGEQQMSEGPVAAAVAVSYRSAMIELGDASYRSAMTELGSDEVMKS